MNGPPKDLPTCMMWANDNSMQQCCDRAVPCAFHRQFPGAVRSPHRSRDNNTLTEPVYDQPFVPRAAQQQGQ